MVETILLPRKAHNNDARPDGMVNGTYYTFLGGQHMAQPSGTGRGGEPHRQVDIEKLGHRRITAIGVRQVSCLGSAMAA